MTRRRQNVLRPKRLVLVLACTLAVACVDKSASRTVEASRTDASTVSTARAPAPLTVVASASDASAAPIPALPANANVLLVTIDSLRADMPWTGYPRPIAPRLTELAAKAVVYTRAYALSSYTSMSLGGLLGGKFPSELKRDGFFFGTYAKNNVFFPELLHDKSVRTMAGHAHGYFNKSGFEQGFDQWEVVSKLKWNNTTDENITSPELYALAEKQLSNPALDASSARFFAWYHFMDPHDRYLPHADVGIAPYGKSIRDRYDAEVTFTDGYVGKLIDLVASKPWGSRTIVVVSSDHGEAFGEHGQHAHGFELWENLVRVPMFVVAPGASPRRIDTPRSHIDLARTMLEIYGVDAPPAFRGSSLVGEIYGAEAGPRDVFLDLPVTSDNDRRRGIVSGDKKVISFGMQGLKRVYDVVADPNEDRPLLSGGDDAKDAIERFRALEKTLVEIPPTACKENCLNGAYLKKDGGT